MKVLIVMCNVPDAALATQTTSEQYGALEAKIQALHPYEVPEIVALPLENGLPAYLGWVVGSVAPLS